jgi:antagonist of SinR
MLFRFKERWIAIKNKSNHYACGHFQKGMRRLETKVITKELDKEWMQLILEAKKLGIEKEEICKFFYNGQGEAASEKS